MFVGCQGHYHMKPSVIFILILFVSVYIFMYKFYEAQAYCLFFFFLIKLTSDLQNTVW